MTSMKIGIPLCVVCFFGCSCGRKHRRRPKKLSRAAELAAAKKRFGRPAYKKRTRAILRWDKKAQPPYRLSWDREKLPEYINTFPRQDYKVKYVHRVGFFYIDDINDHIKNIIRKGIAWEGRVHNNLNRYIIEGTTVIDVGAHIGSHTLTMARIVGPSGRVYAFEPQKKIFRELVHNIALNEMDNIIPFRMAAGSRPGTVKIRRVDYGRGKVNEGGMGLGATGYPAEMRTLDSFGFTNVSLIKIDVEGHEIAVLKGSLATIRKNRPVIIIEITGGPLHYKAPKGTRKQDYTIKMLENMGYAVEKIHTHNYLALPRPKVR